MPTPLPPLADLAGSGSTPTSDAFRAAIGSVRNFLAEKLGTSGTNSDAQTALGASTVGKSVFGITDELALTKFLGSGSIASDSSKLHFLLGRYFCAQAGTEVVVTNGSGLATITFPSEFLKIADFQGQGAGPIPPLFAVISLGDVTSMSPIAPVASTYTSTSMQIKCAANVTIRVNWLAIAVYQNYSFQVQPQ